MGGTVAGIRIGTTAQEKEVTHVWRLSIGRFVIYGIQDGGMIRLVKELYPDAPSTAFAGLLEDGQLAVPFGEFLISDGDRFVLVDTGPGFNGDSYPGGSKGELSTALTAIGVNAADITLIIHTHLHRDHCGGDVTEAGVPAFPNASVIVQQDENDFWMTSDLANSHLVRAAVAPIQAAGLWQTVQGNTEVAAGLNVVHAPGHTPGHQFVATEADGISITFGGDAIHHPLQVGHPEWTFNADLDSDQARTTRTALLDRPGVIALNHLPRAGTIELVAGARSFVEVPTQQIL